MRSIYWLSGGVVGLAGVSSALLVCSAPSVAEDQPAQLELKGIIRDFVPDSGNPDFTANPSETPGAKSAKNIAMDLDDANKPVYVGNGKKVDHEWKDCHGNVIGWCQPPITQPANQADDPGNFVGHDNGAINSAASFSQWFRDVPGVNSSRLWTLTLNWVPNDNHWGPHYKFSTNDFNPVVDPATDEETFFFTYEIAANFTYHAADNQFLWYKGSEDVWVFINDKLMIDHGGIAAHRDQCICLNRLDLAEGQQYMLRLFMAERWQPQTQLHLKTNMNLQTAEADSIFAAFD